MTILYHISYSLSQDEIKKPEEEEEGEEIEDREVEMNEVKQSQYCHNYWIAL